MRVAMLLLVALAQSSCSTTLPPIQGQSSDGSETVTGKATGYAGGRELWKAVNQGSSIPKALSVIDVEGSGVSAVYAVYVVADLRRVTEPQTHPSATRIGIKRELDLS
jgi:hypothetical protein